LKSKLNLKAQESTAEFAARTLAARFISYPLHQLIQRVEVFAGFEADGAAWCDADFGSGARVAAYSGFAWAHVEDSEAAQLDAVSLG
jgi:hypothetical protein